MAYINCSRVNDSVYLTIVLSNLHMPLAWGLRFVLQMFFLLGNEVAQSGESWLTINFLVVIVMAWWYDHITSASSIKVTKEAM